MILLLFVLALLAGCGFTGCGPSRESRPGGPGGREEPPRPGGILRVSIAADPTSMNPLLPRPGRQVALWRYFYPSLFEITPRGALPPEPRGDLARRWDWSDEAQALTVVIRRDRLWEDTTRVRVDDVVQTYAAYKMMGRLPAAAGRDSVQDPGLIAVEAVDDSTVRLRFRSGFSFWRALPVATWPILPGHKLGKLERTMLEASPLNREPLSAGPFRLLEWRPGLNFWMGRNWSVPRPPWLRMVAFEPSPGIDSRILRLVFGEADVVTDVPVFRLPALLEQSADSIRLYSGGPASVEMIVWNLRQGGALPLVRDAVSLALDRERILEDLASWRGARYGGIAGGVLEPAGPAEFDSVAAASPLPRFDHAAADSLLDAAGWNVRNEEGMRMQDGLPMRIEMIYDRGNELRERMITYVEEDLARIGVQLDARPLDGAVFWERYRSGIFGSALLGFTVPPTPDVASLWASWGYWNRGGYASAAVDSLIRAQQSTSAAADVARFSRAIEAQIRHDRPVTFLIYLDGVALLSPRVRGFSGTPWSPYGKLENAWLADTTAAGPNNVAAAGAAPKDAAAGASSR